MPDDMPDIPDVGCCEFYGPEAEFGCECGPVERALRAWKEKRHTATMTPAQREWCLSEIASVEGYERKDHEAETDADLASTVLHAWTDYCRDKGLL